MEQIQFHNYFKVTRALILLLMVVCDVYTVLVPMCSNTVRKLGIDEASLTITTEGFEEKVFVQMISSECHSCRLQTVTYIDASQSNCTVIVDTRWYMLVTLIGENNKKFGNCSDSALEKQYLDGGKYLTVIKNKNGSVSCMKPYMLNVVSDSNIPIYVAIGIIAALCLIWIVIVKIYHSRMINRVINTISDTSTTDPLATTERDLGTPTNSIVDQEKSGSKPKERLKSLDTFRGISLVVMIFVNYGGGQYWFFQHSKWNGLTVADLVFPWFIWIMGTAMAFSFKSINQQGTHKAKIFLKIIRRSIILFALGLLVSSAGRKDPVDFTKIRILGVLQRFAFTYFIIATLHLLFTKPINMNADTALRPFRDIVNYWPEWIINFMLVMIHVLLTFLLKVPGCPTGYLGPGGLAEDVEGYNVTLCTGGAAGYIDRKVFGDAHIYQHPTCSEIYNTVMPYEPEGLLGVLTSCFLCFLGLQAGKILVTYPDPIARVTRFSVWSVILGSIAAILCKASKDDGWIPVNKNLWSLSFVLALSAMAFFLFTVCYLMVDVFHIWTGAPFFFPGMNSIVVYVAHEFFSQPFNTFWGIEPGSHAIALLVDLMDVSLWIAISFFMYLKGIFISI